MTPSERTVVDRKRIVELSLKLGPNLMEDYVSTTMEEIAVFLAALERAHEEGAFDRLAELAARIQEVARDIGLVRLASVAGDLQGLATTYDSAALAAVTGRVVRLGEAALFSQLDADDAFK